MQSDASRTCRSCWQDRGLLDAYDHIGRMVYVMTLAVLPEYRRRSIGLPGAR